MPYLLLVLGLIVAAVAIYRVFVSTDTGSVKEIVVFVAGLGLIIILSYLAVTGKLALAIAGICILVIVALKGWYYKRMAAKSKTPLDSQGKPDIDNVDYEVVDDKDGNEDDKNTK